MDMWHASQESTLHTVLYPIEAIHVQEANGTPLKLVAAADWLILREGTHYGKMFLSGDAGGLTEMGS